MKVWTPPLGAMDGTATRDVRYFHLISRYELGRTFTIQCRQRKYPTTAALRIFDVFSETAFATLSTLSGHLDTASAANHLPFLACGYDVKC